MINISDGISYNANTGKTTANIGMTTCEIGDVSSPNFPSALASSNLYTKDDAAYASPAKIHQDHPFS